MEFLELIDCLRKDCNTYHFCKDGLRGVAKATSVEDCVGLLKNNIVWCFDSPYHQVIAENIDTWFEQWPEAFRHSGVFVNEAPDNARAIMIITRPTDFLLSDHNRVAVEKFQRCFVFGTAELTVRAWNYSIVYCKNPNAEVFLYDKALGYCKHVKSISAKHRSVVYVEHTHLITCTNWADVYLTADCDLVQSYHSGKVNIIENFNFQ